MLKDHAVLITDSDQEEATLSTIDCDLTYGLVEDLGEETFAL